MIRERHLYATSCGATGDCRCGICDGSLALCLVCHAAEAQLERSCPGPPGRKPRPLGCEHLVVDEDRERTCLVCGLRYDRAEVLERLKETIRARHRLPPSPWTGAERVMDLWD